MSSTPLMSEYPQEKVENQVPVIYAIDESDTELVVGAPKRRCFWSRFHSRRCHSEGDADRKKRRCRAFKIFLFLFLVLGVFGFAFAKHRVHHHRRLHPITCVPLSEESSTLTLPLASQKTHIGIHKSLSSGLKTTVEHSDDIPEGHVQISFEYAKELESFDEEGDAEVYVCNIQGPRHVGVGLHSKNKGPHPKATSVSIKLSSAEAGKPRGISLQGIHRFGRFHHGPGCMKRRIRHAIAKAIRLARAQADKAVDEAKVFDAELN